MHSYRVFKSTSTATRTSTTTFEVSQPEPAVRQRHQSSFVGLSTTIHTLELPYISAGDQQFAGLRLLAEVSTSQIDPFEALATHQAVTFGDEVQEQSASHSSQPDGPFLPSEPSHSADDVDPIMVVEEPHETGILEDPKISCGKNPKDQAPDSIDKWIMYSRHKKRPFKCGYEGCGKTYITKQSLQRHLISHTGDSEFRCYTGDCTGAIRYWDKQTLNRHIYKKHTMEKPFECDICNRRFVSLHNLSIHRRNMHSIKDKRNQPQNSDSTDKWIIYIGGKNKLFKCGYDGCGKTYTEKKSLRRHFISHIGDSQFRCYTGDCTGEIRYCDSQALARHINIKHTMERPFKCNICNNRFVSIYNLIRHRRDVHSVKYEQNQP